MYERIVKFDWWRWLLYSSNGSKKKFWMSVSKIKMD